MSGVQNPPAFPNTDEFASNLGMSLRDWFAGQALNGFMACKTSDGLSWDQIAMSAFASADAMLAERTKNYEARQEPEA